MSVIFLMFRLSAWKTTLLPSINYCQILSEMHHLASTWVVKRGFTGFRSGRTSTPNVLVAQMRLLHSIKLNKLTLLCCPIENKGTRNRRTIGISHDLMVSTSNNHLDQKKNFARCVSRLLTIDHKCQHVTTSIYFGVAKPHTNFCTTSKTPTGWIWRTIEKEEKIFANVKSSFWIDLTKNGDIWPTRKYSSTKTM